MNSVESFLEAIQESPGDDDLRMVFGDWLEDRGDGRGELVRLSVRLATMAPEDPGRRHLTRLMERARRRDEAAWLGALQGHVDGWKVERGLLHVTGTARELKGRLALAEDALAWLEGLRLEVKKLADLEACLRALKSPRLKVLDLSRNHLGPDVARVLLAWPMLGQLETLDLRDNDLGADGAAILSRAPHLQQLRELWLSGNAIGDRGVRALAERPTFATLRILDLNDNDIGDDGAEALAESPHLDALTRLETEDNNLRAAGVQALRARFGARVVL